MYATKVLGRVRQLTLRELLRVALYAGQLALVRAVLARRPLESLVQRWSRTDERGTVSTAEAEREAVLVHLAARGTPWGGNCLHRSVVLWRRLQRLGTASELHLGVRAAPGGPPEFHAWLGLDGTVVNDRRDVADHYRVLTDAAARGAAARTSASMAATSSGRRARSEA